MSTKAQLEQEIIKMNDEKELLLRQIKNLKKRKNPLPVVPIDINKQPEFISMKVNLADTKATLDKIRSEHTSMEHDIVFKNKLISLKEEKIASFIALSWFERVFLSKDDLKRLL